MSVSSKIYTHVYYDIPSGKLTYHSICGKSPFLMCELTISMAMASIAMFVYQRVYTRRRPIVSKVGL